MNKVIEEDKRINEKYQTIIDAIFAKSKNKFLNEFVEILQRNKAFKNMILDIKTHHKIKMVNKLFNDGDVSMVQRNEYITKVKTERTLISMDTVSYEKVLFETEDCFVYSKFVDGCIKYYINQYGMVEEVPDVVSAIEKFTMITI